MAETEHAVTTAKEIEAYWSARPCNIRHGTAPIGTPEWSAQVTQRKYFVEPHIPKFAQFERWKGKRVLEIGCGIGTDTLSFLRAGAKFIDAIDISSHSISLAFNRVSGAGLSNASFHCCDAEERIPISWGYDCELIYSFGVLHHTPHPERVLRMAKERLSENGELRIMLYAKWSIKNLMRQQPEAQAGCPYVKFYSGWEARKLLWNSGFKVESIRKTHIFPWRVEDYIQHRYVKAWPYSWMPKWFFSLLERLLGAHLLIVARPA